MAGKILLEFFPLLLFVKSNKINELAFGYKFSKMYNQTVADEPIVIDVCRLPEVEKV